MSCFRGVQCIRCGKPLADNPYYEGCPYCSQEGGTVNYTTVYDVKGAKLPDKNSDISGIYRYKDFLPLHDNASPVSINEGNTPLIKLNKLGETLGISNLYLKDESKNPTYSYKDRLASVVVTKAVQDKVPAITISSTGNHGAAVAAYAAKAGLPCVIFTTPDVPDTMKTIMQVYGASLVMVPTSLDRWKIMGECVKLFNWMPASGFKSPPIGSNCYGIDGYKTIAFELYEQLNEKAPDMVIMPIAYADGLYGTYKGMCDLKNMGYIQKLPKMVASEVFGPMQETLRQGAEFSVCVESGKSISFSIGGSFCTYQGLEAVRKSNGYARRSNDDETIEMQFLLANKEGIYAEASSVTSLVAAKKLAQEGKIGNSDRVVAVITSTGLKDTGTTKKHLPEVPLIRPELNELQKALKNTYGINI